MRENNNDSEYGQPNKSYEDLTGKCQTIVDELVDNPNRTNGDIADVAGASGSMVPYVEENFGHIIDERRDAMDKGVSSDAEKAAREMALPDGSGADEFVDVVLTEDELFQCVKILPKGLSQVFWVQARTGRRPTTSEE